MSELPILTDNQPISARFFGEGKWLNEFITPTNLEVETLYKNLTENASNPVQKISAIRAWVTQKLKYKPFIAGTLTIEGKTNHNSDLWLDPSTTIRTGVGNCANKSFVLVSLLRNEFPDSQVFCVLGNLHSTTSGGHAWGQITIDDQDYVIETTTDKVPPLVPVESAKAYEPVHLFNDNPDRIYVYPGRTVLQPFSAVYSTWLENYLDWAYINGKSPS
jgi:transglutaminase-like putative cysteine protease